MPKPFTISLDIEEAMLGPVMRKIQRMPGVISIDFDFDSPTGELAEDEDEARPNGRGGDRRSTKYKKDTKHAKPRLPGVERKIDIVARIVNDKPMTGRELAGVLGETSHTAVSNALRAELVRKNAKGIYYVTAKGEKRLEELKHASKG